MNKTIALVGIVLAILTAYVSAAVDKKSLLMAHNAERSLVGAPALTWSNSLQQFAQQWANTLKNQGCKLKHRTNRKVNGQVVGENLAMWYNGAARCNKKVNSKNDAYGVCLWNEEKDNYVYGKQCQSNDKGAACAKCTKGACGHYTQVVWKNTKQMGCGVATCSNGYSLLVCNYASAGNYIGQYPFPSNKKSAFKKQAAYGGSSSTTKKSTNKTTKKTKKKKKSKKNNKSNHKTVTENGIRVESLGAGCRVTNIKQEGVAEKRHVKVKCGSKQQGLQLYDQKFIKDLNQAAYDPDYYQSTVLTSCTQQCEVCSVSVDTWGPWC
mmetsp:Transcript_3622/g.5351  ORF Transcript_3622/g.5351 Transcript_3622/m.5351 type:complete len:323 (+) Transcript_3622:53-1021(+)